jgi:tetratricopeptide (TPR) repeat protein
MKAILRSLLTVLAVSVVATGTLALSGCAKNPHLAGGILYLSQKNYDKAVKELQTAVDQEPNNGLAHLRLAMAYAEVGDTKKAGQEFDKAVSLSSKLKKDVDANRRHYWVIRFNEGVRLSSQEKNYESAAKEFEKAIDLDPNDPRAYSNLAFSYAQLGKREEALAMFEKAATIAPNDATARKNLAAVYMDLGKAYFKQENYPDALKFYEKALELGSDSVTVMFQLGNCYFQTATAETSTALAMPGFEKAGSFYERVLRKSPDDLDAMTNLGMVKLALDQVNEAIQLLSNVVKKEPKVSEVHKLLVRAYAKIGEQELAVTELVISKALDPSRGRRMSDLDSWLSQDGMKARYGDTGDMTKILQELGTPEEVYVYEESGSLVETWFYWSKGIGQYFANGKTPPKSRVTFTPVTEK